MSSIEKVFAVLYFLYAILVVIGNFVLINDNEYDIYTLAGGIGFVIGAYFVYKYYKLKEQK